MDIHKVDQRDRAVKARLRDTLAEHEAHALFILGNLAQDFPGSHLYVAERDGGWVGVAGYYAGPRSLIPFSLESNVVRALVRHVAAAHPGLRYMNGIDYVAEPAREELFGMGYRPANDPDQVFMELQGLPPPQRHERLARQMEASDAEQVARLLRHLHGRDDVEAPVTEEETRKVLMNPLRHVLVADGKIVSTAATNGVGVEAFQILGVATEPAFRRRGYARAVCAALIRAMAGRGANRSVIFTHRNNTPARRCYEALGFRVTGSYCVARFEPPAD